MHASAVAIVPMTMCKCLINRIMESTQSLGGMALVIARYFLVCLTIFSPSFCAVAEQPVGASEEQLDCSGAPDQRTSYLCQQQEFDEVDAKLNAAYKKLKGKLGKDDAKRLVDAQRAWLEYVKADCLFSPGPPPREKDNAFAAFPDTLYSLQLTNCRLDHWQTRLKILEQDNLDM
jgi:uncharacterized protein YecT (DUF1311 family)